MHEITKQSHMTQRFNKKDSNLIVGSKQCRKLKQVSLRCRWKQMSTKFWLYEENSSVLLYMWLGDSHYINTVICLTHDLNIQPNTWTWTSRGMWESSLCCTLNNRPLSGLCSPSWHISVEWVKGVSSLQGRTSSRSWDVCLTSPTLQQQGLELFPSGLWF